ncbi:hypothetical protein ACJIZ3_010338 [Penstemon smallii]|uniref:Transmembrane protein n=1 Tax=Penstemon smallii TaxID=265156 RepID=A0ABD3TFQ6_9LAMI
MESKYLMKSLIVIFVLFLMVHLAPAGCLSRKLVADDEWINSIKRMKPPSPPSPKYSTPILNIAPPTPPPSST